MRGRPSGVCYMCVLVCEHFMNVGGNGSHICREPQFCQHGFNSLHSTIMASSELTDICMKYIISNREERNLGFGIPKR